MDQLLMLLVI